MSLRYASKELKNNEQIVMAAVTNNGESLKFVSEKKKQDFLNKFINR